MRQRLFAVIGNEEATKQFEFEIEFDNEDRLSDDEMMNLGKKFKETVSVLEELIKKEEV